MAESAKMKVASEMKPTHHKPASSFHTPGMIDPWSLFSEIPQKINEIISQYIHENADSFCLEIFQSHRQIE
jgi:hypothetical protein